MATDKNEFTPEEEAIQLTPEQEEAILKSLEEAKQPIVLTDGKFQLGEREINIMQLSKKFRDQLLFRMICHVVSYNRSIHQDLVDVMKLMMLVLKSLGVKDIIKATEELELELAKTIAKQTN